jgi:hypothetical protein
MIVAASERLKNLEHMSLNQNTKISNVGMRALAAAAYKFKNLSKIWLKQTQATEQEKYILLEKYKFRFKIFIK